MSAPEPLSTGKPWWVAPSAPASSQARTLARVRSARSVMGFVDMASRTGILVR